MKRTNLLAKAQTVLLWRLFQLVKRTKLPIAANKKLEWQLVHQRFELDFHRDRNYRWDDEAFRGRWDKVFGDFLGLGIDSFGDEDAILDVGCGSRPAFDWFKSRCKKYYVDPLLCKYLGIPRASAYWEDKTPDELICKPAEEFVSSLENRCDFVNCWNALDHAYDWRQVLENIARYAKSGSLVCIGTDFSYGLGHTGIDDESFFCDLIRSYFYVDNRKTPFSYRDVALKLLRK